MTKLAQQIQTILILGFRTKIFSKDLVEVDLVVRKEEDTLPFKIYFQIYSEEGWKILKEKEEEEGHRRLDKILC